MNKKIITLLMVFSLSTSMSQLYARFTNYNYVLVAMNQQEISQTKEDITEWYANAIATAQSLPLNDALAAAQQEISSIDTQNHYFFNIVSTETAQILGYFWYNILYGNEYIAPYGHIIVIYVKQEYRGNGIAAQVLDDFEQELKAKGIHKMEAFVFSNNTSVCNLYQKIGGHSTSHNNQDIGIVVEKQF